jgi:hypothetical protein
MPWRSTLNFLFVSKNRVKIGTSSISGCLKKELQPVDVCERYSYPLIMSKKEGFKSPFLIPWI